MNITYSFYYIHLPYIQQLKPQANQTDWHSNVSDLVTYKSTYIYIVLPNNVVVLYMDLVDTKV